MPFEYAWKVVLPDCSELELEAFLDGQKSYLKKNSQHEACGVCNPRYFEHKMHYVIYKCGSSTCHALSCGQDCEWFAKSIMCDVTKRCVVYQHGHHLSTLRSPPHASLNLTMKRFVREQTDAKVMPSRILNKMIDTFSLDNASELLPRVQQYSYYYREQQLADTNYVEDLEALAASKPYLEELNAKTSFAYGYPVNSNDILRSPQATWMTPTNVLHIDATFKLNKSRFPVVILGVSVVRRQFHPVCFFITSDIKQQQIESIIRATFRQFQTMTGSMPVITYVMADADNAERNAMEAIIAQELNVAIRPTYLMCFFHVMKNVKEYLAGMSASSRELVFKHVYRIQYARTSQDLHVRVVEALEAWQGRPDCVEFQRKFTKQWLSGRYSLWQCLTSPPGFAKTNNPVEQFNKQVKRDYTLRTKINTNMLAQELLCLANHPSVRQKPFEQVPRPSEDLVKRYKELKKEDRLIVKSYRSAVAFMLDGDNRRIYHVIQRGIDQPKPKPKESKMMDEEALVSEHVIEVFQQPPLGWAVDVDAATCECRVWFKFCYCVHLIAARMHVGLHVEGVSKKRKFVTKGGPGTQRKGKQPTVGHALAME